MPYRSVNPATGEALKTFTEHTDQEVEMEHATHAPYESFVYALGELARER